MKLKTIVPLFALVLVMGLVLVGPSTGRPPLVHPDEPDTCIGNNDPFCAPGGSGGTCKICQLIGSPVHTVQCKLDPIGQGDTCTIEWDGTSGSCGITGSC